MSDTKTIQWTKPMRERFRKAYQKAVTDQVKVFTFDGNEYVISYAGYLLQYLDTLPLA